MEPFMQLVESHLATLLLVSLGLTVMSLILLFITMLKHAGLSKRHKKLMRGIENKNLEEILNNHLDKVNRAVERVNEVNNTCKELKRMAEKSVQKMGVIRFNAFADTGSDLSFAVAMLDNFGDGVVLSSIFGRDDQRTYVKPISKGDSTYHLSNEEIQAIQIALKQS